jgi:hypothetical protein
MNTKGCYINDKGEFVWDDEHMSKWYNNAMKEIEKVEADLHAIPYMVFLMGCEAALRMREVEKLH